MENVPKIVTARLQRTRLRERLPEAEAHPDADLLTAFAEQALAGREREGVIDHLARCGDCREIVALSLPATEIVAPAHLAGTDRIRWMRWPVLRWGVVTAGIVAVASVGVLQYSQRSKAKTLVAVNAPVVAQRLEARGTPLAPASAATDALSGALSGQSANAPQAVVREQKRATLPSAVPADKSVSTANAIFPPSHVIHGTATRGGTIGGPIRNGFSGGAPDHALGTGSSAGRSATNLPVFPQGNASSQESGEQVGRAKAVPKEAFAFQMAPAPPLHTEPTLMKSQSTPRWTISESGALQRSLDQGRTWVEIAVNSNRIPAFTGSTFADAAKGSAYGSITGSVKDPSGAVIAGAVVTLSNLSTTGNRTVLTGSDGRFTFANVSPGDYRINVEKAGFATLAQSTIAVNAQQNERFDAMLQVGAAGTAVEVTGAAPELEVETTAARAAAAPPAKKSEIKEEQRDKKYEVQRLKTSLSGISPVFRALAANGLEVWAGGSEGALYHTVDGGNRWTRVAPSTDGVSLTGDIIGIQFSDPRNGTVTTSTAEVWTTSDDGQSWSKQ